MRLEPSELANIIRILDRIDRRVADPHVPDRLGRFLRQYKTGRAKIDSAMAGSNASRRQDSAISGQTLGAIELHTLHDVRLSTHGFPTGDIAEALALSEELGGLVTLALWLKGPHATAAYEVIKQHRAVRLSGDYRWTPPWRLTIGEAISASAITNVSWSTARCLKATSDDLLRPPHALEFVAEYQKGPPGLKFFRCICARRKHAQWEVLPGYADARVLEIETTVPEVIKRLRAAQLATLLIYSEPWSRKWTIVDALEITVADAFAHAISWADFRAELDGKSLRPEMLSDISSAFESCDLEPDQSFEPNLGRVLLPVARGIVRSLRGYD